MPNKKTWIRTFLMIFLSFYHKVRMISTVIYKLLVRSFGIDIINGGFPFFFVGTYDCGGTILGEKCS